MTKLVLFLRATLIALVTLVFIALSFSGYIGWRETSGTTLDLIEISVLGAGFLPWVTWVVIISKLQTGNIIIPLVIGAMMIFPVCNLLIITTHVIISKLQTGNIIIPLVIGAMMILIHYALFAFLGHAYKMAYIALQVTEALLTAASIYSLKQSSKG